MFGDTVNKSVIEHIEQPSPEEQGLLLLEGTQNGLYHSEQWRILELTKDFMISSYCGTMTSWVYRGAVVLVRSPHVDMDLAFRIREGLLLKGFRTEDFCSPKTLGCSLQDNRLKDEL